MLPEEFVRRKGLPPRVGVLNTPTPNPDDYHEGKAIYVNEPGFYSIVVTRVSRLAATRKSYFFKGPANLLQLCSQSGSKSFPLKWGCTLRGTLPRWAQRKYDSFS